MKRFQFRLEPLLNYRKYLERIAQQETAKAQLDVKTCEKMIEQLEGDLLHQSDQWEATLQKGMTAFEFRRFFEFSQGMESRIEDENKRKEKLDYLLKKKIEKLKKKSVEKKAMELYRERKKTIYDQEVLKAEQKELDEISSLKTARTAQNETNK